MNFFSMKMQSLGILLTFKVGLFKFPRGKEEDKRAHQTLKVRQHVHLGDSFEVQSRSHVGIPTVHTDIMVLLAVGYG